MTPPNGWEKATLGEVIRPGRSKASPREFGALRYVGLEHIAPNALRIHGWSAASSMKSQGVQFRAGDVLYARLRPYLNKVACSDFSGICSAEFIVLPAPPGIEPKFVQYLMHSSRFVSFSSHQNEGDRPRVDFAQISEFEFSLPPSEEQRRIVAAIEQHLSRIDAGVAALERVKKELARYHASVLKAACEGRLVPTEATLAHAESRSFEPASELLARILAERRARSDASGSKRSKKYVEPRPPELREVPEGWILTTLGALFRVFVGATPSRGEPSYWNGGIPWVSSGEVAFRRIARTREAISQLGLENSSTNVHPPGSVLLGMIGEGKTRGQAAILDIEACNNQNCAAIRVSETPVMPELVYYYLERVYEETRQIGSGNNQPALNKTLVEQLPVPLPPLAEQRRIVAEVERRLSIADEVAAVVEAALVRAGRLRQAVLKRAFEGRLVPQDSSDEPASVLLERIRADHARLDVKPKRRKRASS